MVPVVSLYFLGAARVERENVALRFETRKALALLTYLVVTAKPHARDSLAALFWPENDQASARGALRRTLSVLKTNLPINILSISREQIGLAPSASFWCDVVEFQGLLNTASQHPHPQTVVCPICQGLYEKAAVLYKGGFLSGFTLRDSPGFDDWQYFETDRLKSEFALTLQKLVLANSSNKAFEKAIIYAQTWVALDPLREEAHQQLMLCFSWAGQRSAALLEYRKCVRSLSDELGVFPLEETTRLYQAILEGKIPAPPGPIESQDLQAEAQPDSAESLSDSPESQPTARAIVFPLVGRSRETETILQIYKKSAGQGRFLILQGEPGIGKTRLAEEFLSYARSRNANVLSARCFAGESTLAYAPFTDALKAARQLSGFKERIQSIPTPYLQQALRLDPEFSNDRFHSPNEQTSNTIAAETLFHEGLRQVFIGLLRGDLPGILFLDDFHWADLASIQQLSYMVHRLSGNRVLILIAVSDEALPEPLNLLVNQSQRTGIASLLKINRLLPSDLNEIVRAVIEPKDRTSQQLALRVYEETEGLPFFVVEYFQSFLVGDVSQNQDRPILSTEWTMPGSVQNLLQSRLNGLDETTWQILTTAAIVGRSFEFQVLLDASGRSELETIKGLENLLARRLIEEVNVNNEQVSDNFDFTHDKVREFVYDQTNPTRRRLIHRRVAEAINQQHRGKMHNAAHTSQIAWHYHMAGLDQESAVFYRAAGDHARSLFANREAIQHYQSALALGYSIPAELHETIGDLQVWIGKYKQAISSFLAAATLANEASQARLEHKLGCVHHRLGEWELATSYFQTATERSEARLDTDELAAIYADWSQTSYRQGKMEEANYFARQSFALVKNSMSHQLISKASNILGILARATGDPKNARVWFETSLDTARQKQDFSAEIAASNNLALLLADEQNYAEAIDLIQAVLQLCQKIGDRHHEASLLNHLAELFHAKQQEEISMDYLKKAVRIFAEIGGTEEVPSPEIWMLSEW